MENSQFIFIFFAQICIFTNKKSGDDFETEKKIMPIYEYDITHLLIDELI